MTHRAMLERSFPTVRLLVAPFVWIGRAGGESCARCWSSWRCFRPSAVVEDPVDGLPDIGDPFDVEAFRAETIPDDRNAFVPLPRGPWRSTGPCRGRIRRQAWWSTSNCRGPAVAPEVPAVGRAEPR